MKKILVICLLLVLSHLAAQELCLDLMFTNDIHGGIDRYPATYMNPDFPPMIGGGASAATYIKRVRENSDGISRDNILLDAGDFFQGHPIGTVTNGTAIIDYMNKIKYEALTVGNHEFDIGEEKLRKTLALADFPILSCNILSKETGEIADFCQPYVFIKKMGLKIAVIGATTTDTDKMSFAEHIKNVSFAPVKPQLEKYIAEVRSKGADLVFLLGHMGLPYDGVKSYKRRYGNDDGTPKKRYWGMDAQEVAHEVEGIDVLIGGHIHKGIAKPWVDPITHTLVVQGYGYGSNVGHLQLKIDVETKTISGWELPDIRNGMMVTMFEDEYVPDKELGPYIEEMQAVAEEGMDTVIGRAGLHLSRLGSGAQNLMGNVVVDAMRAAVNADFAFINLGGIRGDIPTGPVTYRDVFNVMPFDNQIVLMEIDGKTLKDIIEVRIAFGAAGLRVSRGMEIVYSKERPNHDRVTKLVINGEPWQHDKIYKVATTDFLMAGNARLTMLTKIPEEQLTRYEKSLRGALEDYFVQNSPVMTAIDNRWLRDDSSVIDSHLEKELKKIKK